MQALLSNCAVIIVSHNLVEIERIANKGLYLSKGVLKRSGDIEYCINTYSDDVKLRAQAVFESLPWLEYEQSCISKPSIQWNESLAFSFKIHSEHKKQVVLRVLFHDANDALVAEWRSTNANMIYKLVEGINELNGEINNLCLRGGQYGVSFIIADLTAREIYLSAFHVHEIQIVHKQWESISYQCI